MEIIFSTFDVSRRIMFDKLFINNLTLESSGTNLIKLLKN